METVIDFIFLGFKITVDSFYSHEMKRCLLLGRKAMINLNSLLENRHHFTDKDLSSQNYDFSSSHVWMWDLGHKEAWAPKNWCLWTVELEKTLGESLGLQGDQICQSQRKSTLNIHWKKWCWSQSSNTLVIWCEVPTHWKRPWCWERLRAGGEGGDRGWEGWMASASQYTWVWANFRKLWRTGKPGVLQSMESQSWTRLSEQQHFV